MLLVFSAVKKASVLCPGRICVGHIVQCASESDTAVLPAWPSVVFCGCSVAQPTTVTCRQPGRYLHGPLGGQEAPGHAVVDVGVERHRQLPRCRCLLCGCIWVLLPSPDLILYCLHRKASRMDESLQHEEGLPCITASATIGQHCTAGTDYAPCPRPLFHHTLWPAVWKRIIRFAMATAADLLSASWQCNAHRCVLAPGRTFGTRAPLHR